MAWVTQKFEGHGLTVSLEEHRVAMTTALGDELIITPMGQQHAHHFAMMLRRAARRLEEIGKGLD
jgi:virulence-associated protein VagC